MKTFKETSLQLLCTILKEELEKYTNLPFHLAMLYLSLEDNLTIYLNDTVIQSVNSICDGTALDLKVKIRKEGDVDDGEIYEIQFLQDWLKDNNYRFTRSFYNTLNFKNSKKNRTSLKLDINTKFSLVSGGLAKHNYVYGKNKTLINCISCLTNYYKINSGTIHLYLIFPYLYFNKDKELRLGPSNIETMVGILRYDSSNRTLKIKSSLSERSFIFTPQGLLALYGFNRSQIKDEAEEYTLKQLKDVYHEYSIYNIT